MHHIHFIQIWLSYGEDFKPCYLMTLHVQLQPVVGYLLNGREKVILRQGETEIPQNTKWKACTGFPENVTCLPVEVIEGVSILFD